MLGNVLTNLTPDDIVLDALPEEVLATLAVRAEWFRKLRTGTDGEEFVVTDLQRWAPGQNVRVAFLGGTTALHKDIAQATQQISESCNITLDFGFDAASGTFRSWSESDDEAAAEIRVSFDQGGYFSLVGTDSTDPNIGAPGAAVGGRPGQRSLNLGGFHVQRPSTWKGTVRHEFLHALGFHHEHQNMRGPCEEAFRWDDDPGYEPTADAQGRFVKDPAGRAPGIYTYLAGFPNFWTKGKIDHNLRTNPSLQATASAFDSASVMLYRFPPSFYKTSPSPCAPSGAGQDLSSGDREGLQTLYPAFGGSPFDRFVERRRDLLDAVSGPKRSVDEESAESAIDEAAPATSRSQFARRAARMLASSLERL